MTLVRILAHVSCNDLAASVDWYAKLFARPPDIRPMRGLVEWHHQGSGGCQLFENAQHAGHGTLVLTVEDLGAEHARLDAAALAPGTIELATSTRLMRLRDPDGNQVVFAEQKET